MITQQKQLVPQLEEGLVDAAWFPFEEAIAKLAYDTDQDIVAKAQAKLLGQPLIRPRSPRRGRVPRIHR